MRHDVTVSDIELAVRENFTAVEHIKRRTTLGMSVDQGKVGRAPAVEVIARVRHVRPSESGHIHFGPNLSRSPCARMPALYLRNSGRVDIICTGPTDWRLIARNPDGAELLRQLDEAFMGSPLRATTIWTHLPGSQFQRSRYLISDFCNSSTATRRSNSKPTCKFCNLARTLFDACLPAFL
jgi:Sarcosine oxidase A3 domain